MQPRYKDLYRFLHCHVEKRIKHDPNFTADALILNDWRNKASTVIAPYQNAAHSTIKFIIQKTINMHHFPEHYLDSKVRYVQIVNATTTILDERFAPTNENLDDYLFSNQAIKIANILLSRKSFQIDSLFDSWCRFKYTPEESYSQFHIIELRISRDGSSSYYVKFKDGKEHVNTISKTHLNLILEKKIPFEELILNGSQPKNSFGMLGVSKR